MKKILDPKYDFLSVEANKYEKWLKQDLFKAGKTNAKPFTIVIPPPNITGKLHLGHAWDNTLQDIIIRRKRMMGYDALYLPGTDHAGLATQARIDAKLKSEGKSRYELGREKYLSYAMDWKDEYIGYIHEQWKALGLSLDYSKEKFTLDADLSKAVTKVFIDLYNKGLIYKANRIINWDCETKTALSNIEVEYQEQTSKLYYFRYPLVNSKKCLVVATTRPETMFADQAIMVHPQDQRFIKMIGQQVYIPGTKVKIPIISDDYVDMEFATGVVKVTPAHDPNDFEVAKRHNLLMPLCMNEDGTMNGLAFEFKDLDRFACRKQLVEKLTNLNLVEKIEDYQNSVGYSERTGVMVEPRLSLQWFVKMKDLADKVNQKSQVEFVPARFKKTFDHWLNNIQDWCISRQIWWGHRIPAWYKDGQMIVSETAPGAGWVQDEDVLDTWFSSALWPFSTLGWPNTNHPDYMKYYPNDVLVTGYDIIFFWVARMIFQALEFTGKDPFKQTLLHGLIRAKDGRKMSKSLGNGVDPIEVINQYGVDSLRYFLVTNSAPGQDLRFDETKVESSWNFINKLWNISRFVMLNASDYQTNFEIKDLNLFDKWILDRLSKTIKQVDLNFEKYEFMEGSKYLYDFIWNEFAAWYLEIAKISLQNEKLKNNTNQVLLYVLQAIIKMLHPICPFVTDEIYSQFSSDSVALSGWPVAKYEFAEVAIFETFAEVVTKLRNIRAEYKIAPTKGLDIVLVADSKETKFINDYLVYFMKFCHASELIISQDVPSAQYLLIPGKVNIYIKKEQLIDKQKELEALNKQKEHLENEIKRSEAMLNNVNFTQKAPPEKLKIETDKYKEYQNQLQTVLDKINNV